jgi:hypothetical protein
MDRLPDKDKTFAQSLLNSVAKYRLPTVKQEYWIKELYNRAVNPPEAPKGESVGDLSRLVTMFTTVKTHLKFPSIRFQTQDGKTFKISPAGDASANKGWLYVKNGSDYLGYDAS